MVLPESLELPTLPLPWVRYYQLSYGSTTRLFMPDLVHEINIYP